MRWLATQRLRRASVSGGLALILGMGSAGPLAAQDDGDAAALVAIKGYLTEHVDNLVEGATAYETWAEAYHAQAEAAGYDYAALWAANGAELPAEIETARTVWTQQASNEYELAEGIVAGVPSLAYFDIWMDAGPTGAEDPDNAYQWTFTLPDGTSYENPGNIFTHITEPALYGTVPELVGLAVDLDGDGALESTEALPEAIYLLGGAQALLGASLELRAEVEAWEPTMSDAFTALVVMLPTAGDYFEQWKLSPFVLGEASESTSFIAQSRLLDVLGIYGGLQVTWEAVSPLVAGTDPALAGTITTGIDDLLTFVRDIHDQETAGTTFTPEQADQFGSQVQDRGDTVAGNVAQAAALLDIELQDL